MQESRPGDTKHAGIIAYPKGPFSAAFHFLVLPNQAMLLFLPVPGLVANGLHVLLILTADALHLPGHGHHHFQARSCFVASKVGSHLDEDDRLQMRSHQSARYTLLTHMLTARLLSHRLAEPPLHPHTCAFANRRCRAGYTLSSSGLIQPLAALLNALRAWLAMHLCTKPRLTIRVHHVQFQYLVGGVSILFNGRVYLEGRSEVVRTPADTFNS